MTKLEEIIKDIKIKDAEEVYKLLNDAIIEYNEKYKNIEKNWIFKEKILFLEEKK